MNISALAFDKPVLYKEILLYPATIKDYTIFKQCSEVLTLNTFNEKDVDLLGLPKLDYIYKKESDENELSLATMLLCVLGIVFRLDSISFHEDENGDALIHIYKPNKLYEEHKSEYEDIYSKYLQCVSVDHQSKIAGVLASKLSAMRDKMYDLTVVNATEFENLKNIICRQNDISEGVEDLAWEKELKKAKEKAAQLNSSGGLDFRDLLIALSYDLKKTPDEMEAMSITTFDRYVDIMLKRESFAIAKAAEANGAKFKKPITHWLSHYSPRGKYDDVVTEKNDSFIEELD